MTVQELRAWLQEWQCGCGSPERAAERLRDILAIHPLYDHQAELEALIPDDGLQYLVLYMLDHLDLTTHGGTVGGGWLTENGEAVLAALHAAAADGFKALSGTFCMHGYNIESNELLDCPECGPLNRPGCD